ncbi:MAG: hypothetical protein JXN65_03555 [Clostridia bacterium]|nr:hypothetical protein [Clostridia bacterium]
MKNNQAAAFALFLNPVSPEAEMRHFVLAAIEVLFFAALIAGFIIISTVLIKRALKKKKDEHKTPNYKE